MNENKRFIFVVDNGEDTFYDLSKKGEIMNMIDTEDMLNHLNEENEELKKELRIYREVASCSNCKYHNYDWDINDGYGGEEYEVCDKGNDVTEGICEDWSEL